MTSPDLRKNLANPTRLSRAQKQLEAVGTPAGEAETPTPVPVETSPKAEVDGPDGPDPTRFGDWERNGRCIDF